MQLHEVVLTVCGFMGTALLAWIRHELHELRADVQAVRGKVAEHGERIAVHEERLDALG